MSPVSRRSFLAHSVAGLSVASAWTARSYGAILGSNEKLRLGIIGCGGMAGSHVTGLLTMKDTDNVEITSVCDVYQKRLDGFVQRTGAKPFSHYKDLLSGKDLDYVLIATPEHWHHQMTLDALDAGKHVYVEKPMAHTVEEAQDVIKKVRDTKLKLQVGVQGMSDESYEVANRSIREGALGKVVMAQIDYSRNYLADFWAYDLDPDARPGVNLDWDAWLGPAPKRPWDPHRYFQWRRYWDYSGGIATDLFIHRITRILKAVGLTFPEYVVGTGGKWNYTDSMAEIPDTFNMLCDYPGGPTVVLISSMANDTPIDHVIRGHKATLEFSHEGFVITPQELSPDAAPDPKQQAEPREIRLLSYRKTGAEDVKLHHRNMHNAIRKGEELKCDAQLGYYGVVAACMGVQSFRERTYLKWNAVKERTEKA
jgi:predicted dehydrogenase